MSDFFKKLEIIYLKNQNSGYSEDIKDLDDEIGIVDDIADHATDTMQIGINNNRQYEGYAENSNMHRQFYDFHSSFFSISTRIEIENKIDERQDELESKKKSLESKMNEISRKIKDLSSKLNG